MLVATLLAGCTLGESDLKAASVATTGRLELGEGLVLTDARITAAARDAPALGTSAAPVELSEHATARTRIARDHWVFHVELRETQPGSAAGRRTASLEWNGALRAPIELAQVAWGRAPEGVTLQFDLGPRLENSSLYVLRVAAVP